MKNAFVDAQMHNNIHTLASDSLYNFAKLELCTTLLSRARSR